jgi:DNA invertase Pin-like site-specific DNA recombinase
MAHLAGYLRVSFVGGREHLQSPTEQTKEIEGWAKAHGHRVDFLDPELDGKGSNPNRPIFREAIEGVTSGRWEGVVVAYLSRAGRDLRLMLDLWDEVEGAGGVVYSARENVDGSTPTSKMQRNFLASISQHELEERRDGFERAARSAVERGVWQRRQTPKGYVKDPETRRLAIDDEGAEEVREAAADFLTGIAVTQLAVRLGMTPGGVRALLRNRVYLGELKVRSYVNQAAHDAILDLPIFEAVQAKLGSRTRPPRSSSPGLLVGLVRCSSCGHVMTRTSGKKGVKAYSCVKYHSGEVCPWPAAITEPRIDRFIEAVALAQLRELEGRSTTGDSAVDAEREVAETQAELSAYLQAVDAAGIGSADAAGGMRSRRERLDQARERLREQLAKVIHLPKLEGGEEIWGTLNTYERNDLLRSLFAAVAVAPSGRGGKRIPVTERTRIFRFGADVTLPRSNTAVGAGIVPIPWPDLDDPRLVPVAGIEDAL